MNNYFENQFGLKGKRAVVTGAGRGIGRAIAEAFAAAGAEVCIHYNKSEAPAGECAAAIEKQFGSGRAWCVGGDLTDSSAVHAVFEKVAQRWGGALDILVNNTGDLVQRRKIADFDDELLEKVLRVNIHSAVYCSRAAIPMLKRGTDPIIINLS